jgi:hypothetical protein
MGAKLTFEFTNQKRGKSGLVADDHFSTSADTLGW